MTPTQIAAIKGMLAYFDSGNNIPVDKAVIKGNCAEVAALRAALAEPAPVQEPVGWSMTYNGSHVGNFYESRSYAEERMTDLNGKHPDALRTVEPLYAAPQAQQPSPPADMPMLTEEATAAAEKAEQERVKAEQKAEAEKLAFQRRLMEEERAAIQADLDAKAAMQREEQDRLKAEADAAEAKVRAAAEAMAAERAELERMRAELEAKSKPAEQPAKEPVGNVSAPTSGATIQQTADSEPVACASGKEATEAKKPYQRPAPIAIEIVMVVAAACNTDTKTAARWITERAAEIESLQ